MTPDSPSDKTPQRARVVISVIVVALAVITIATVAVIRVRTPPRPPPPTDYDPADLEALATIIKIFYQPENDQYLCEGKPPVAEVNPDVNRVIVRLTPGNWDRYSDEIFAKDLSSFPRETSLTPTGEPLDRSRERAEAVASGRIFKPEMVILQEPPRLLGGSCNTACCAMRNQPGSIRGASGLRPHGLGRHEG